MDNKKEESCLFFDNLLFIKVFRTFRLAIQPSKMMIAFGAVAVIFFAGWIMDLSGTVVTDGDGQTELQVYFNSPERMEEFIEANKQTGRREGVFATLLSTAHLKFHNALRSLFAFDIPGMTANIGGYFKAVGWALKYHFIYCLIFMVLKLAVIAVSGGSICRSAALQFARGEKPGLVESLRFGAKKFPSFFGAPLLPVGIIIVAGICVFFVGLLGNIPRIGELVVGISMPLTLLAGATTAVIIIGAVAGFNLMFPAIAYDGSDCFDSISRAFSYVYSRPWRMAFYSIAAGIYGSICYIFVRFFAFLLLFATHMFLRLGLLTESGEGVNKLQAIWPKPGFMSLLGTGRLSALNWAELISCGIIKLFLLVVAGLVISFILSFYFSANTIIYSLMRNKVDNTAINDVYIPAEQEPEIESESADKP